MKAFRDQFTGKITHEYTCTSCKNTSENDKPFNYLLLKFPDEHHERNQYCKVEFLIQYHLQEEKIKEIVLYFEPFVAYIPEQHHHFNKQEIEVADLNIDEILLLQDGHCFRDGILNLCKNNSKNDINHFQIESGSFETLIKLADEGLGTTLLRYLHTLDLKDADKSKLRHFKEPKPAREVSLIYPKSELKIHIIDALRTTISGVIKGAITFQNVEIISPLQKK